jgi:hypothetical protein
MPDYSKGQIYKITDVGQTKCYIGSTIQQLCYRMASHRANYKNYLDGTYTFVSVFSLFEEFGVENCKMVWVKDFPCNNKKELEAEEGRIQKETDCVNKKIAGRTRAQLFQEHPEKKAMFAKKYRQNNPEKIREDSKKEREKKGKVKHLCVCGSTYTYFHKTRHEKSNKHKQYLQNQSNPQEQ